MRLPAISNLRNLLKPTILRSAHLVAEEQTAIRAAEIQSLLPCPSIVKGQSYSSPSKLIASSRRCSELGLHLVDEVCPYAACIASAFTAAKWSSSAAVDFIRLSIATTNEKISDETADLSPGSRSDEVTEQLGGVIIASGWSGSALLDLRNLSLPARPRVGECFWQAGDEG
jgi:hypothetical protein